MVAQRKPEVFMAAWKSTFSGVLKLHYTKITSKWCYYTLVPRPFCLLPCDQGMRLVKLPSGYQYFSVFLQQWHWCKPFMATRYLCHLLVLFLQQSLLRMVDWVWQPLPGSPLRRPRPAVPAGVGDRRHMQTLFPLLPSHPHSHSPPPPTHPHNHSPLPPSHPHNHHHCHQSVKFLLDQQQKWERQKLRLLGQRQQQMCRWVVMVTPLHDGVLVS